VSVHRPDPAMPHAGCASASPSRRATDTFASQPQPGSLRPPASTGSGLVTAPGPLGHADQEQNLVVGMPASTRITPRSAKGPIGPPRTSSTPAARPRPPRAWVRSATSASSCCSRVEGRTVLSRSTRPYRPPGTAAAPRSRPTARTPSPAAPPRRPDSSPARIDITIRVFSSADTAGGLDMMIRLLDGQTARNGPCQKV
jgi:hypothetical protein